MSNLKYLVIHCTDTPAYRHVTKRDIEKWHLEDNGWSQVGYSDMIHLDGELESLVPFNQDNRVDNWEVTNGAKGYNSKSRHIVYVGGKDGDTRTIWQRQSLLTYVKYMILRHPNIKVIGHNEVSSKSCPSFNVGKWLRNNGIYEKNIGV